MFTPLDSPVITSFSPLTTRGWFGAKKLVPGFLQLLTNFCARCHRTLILRIVNKLAIKLLFYFRIFFLIPTRGTAIAQQYFIYWLTPILWQWIRVYSVTEFPILFCGIDVLFLSNACKFDCCFIAVQLFFSLCIKQPFCTCFIAIFWLSLGSLSRNIQ